MTYSAPTVPQSNNAAPPLDAERGPTEGQRKAIMIGAGVVLVLLIVGGLFVVETASVIIQVGSYKLRRKRVFLMAPIHHHYELKGWEEPKIIVRFWLVSVLLALVALGTLKLR